MVRRLAIVVALIACGGSDASDKPAPAAAAAAKSSLEKPPAPDEPAGFAVLRASTPLHRRPSADSPSVMFDPREAGSYGEAYRAFEVVGHEGDWISLRNLSHTEAEKHCSGGWEALSKLQLDFWVRKADLQSVARRPVVEKFADGTSVMISAGAPVMLTAQDEGRPRYRAVGPGANAELPLPDGAAGRFYRPSAVYKPDTRVTTVPRATGLLLEGRPLLNEPLLGEGEQVDVFARERREDGALLTVGTKCAELRVLARGLGPDDVADPDAEIARAEKLWRDLDAKPDTRSYTFAPETKVFWYDGEPAGVVKESITFTATPTKTGDKRCFDHANLTLCFRADDIQ